MEHRTGISCKRLNNQGSAMIMALAVISLVAILGALSLSTALLNLKMRDLNRRSDRNFYYLETALDEIYARTGMVTAEQLKDSYAKTVEQLYQGDMTTNAKANQAFSRDAMENLLKTFKLQGVQDFRTSLKGGVTVTDEALCRTAADLLEGYSETFREKKLDASVEAIVLGQGRSGEEDTDSSTYDTLVFKGLCLTYTEPETAIQSSLTVDLQISVPYLRFINEGDALFDYVLVANDGLRIGELDGSSGDWGGRGEQEDESIRGNVYGGYVDINRAHVRADSRLMTAKGAFTIRNQGKLAIGSPEDGRLNSLWAQNMELYFSAALTSVNTDLYIEDDLTLKGDKNYVKLEGRYFGYGNEGAGEKRINAPDRSSAILMNDKSSTIDMEDLDTLMLAGRAYLRFNSEGNNLQYVYPMGESLAVRATQAMYLIPEKDITLNYGGVSYPAGSNPVILPEGVDEARVAAVIPKEIAGGAEDETVEFTITAAASQTLESGRAGRIAAESPARPHALMIELNGKFYLYYDFNSDSDRTKYFERYLSKNGDNFDDYLRRSGVTGGGPGSGGNSGTAGQQSGGIRINGDGQIVTSGALYQVTGTDGEGGGHLFQLFELKKGETGDSLRWAQLSERLKQSFVNLQTNLSETIRVKDRAGGSGAGVLLPAGNYVNLKKVADELQDEPCYTASLGEGEGSVFLSAADLTVTLGEGNAEIEVKGSHGSSFTVPGGLIVSSGNITVESEGGSDASKAVFNGLMIAGGNIDIVGKAEFTADSERYQSLLDDEAVSEYFYDYGDVTSAAFIDYSDFVTRENWIRAGRKAGGNK